MDALEFRVKELEKEVRRLSELVEASALAGCHGVVSTIVLAHHLGVGNVESNKVMNRAIAALEQTDKVAYAKGAEGLLDCYLLDVRRRKPKVNFRA